MDTFDLDAFRASLYDAASVAGKGCAGEANTSAVKAVNELLIAMREAAAVKSLTARDVQRAVEGFYEASKAESQSKPTVPSLLGKKRK